MDPFLWLGLIFISAVLSFLLYEDWRLLSRPRRRTKGVVFDHYKSTDDGAETFSPKVRFETEDGRSIEITDTYGTPTAKPPIGSVLCVVYPIAAPTAGRVYRPVLRVVIYGLALLMFAIMLGRIIGVLK